MVQLSVCDSFLVYLFLCVSLPPTPSSRVLPALYFTFQVSLCPSVSLFLCPCVSSFWHHVVSYLLSDHFLSVYQINTCYCVDRVSMSLTPCAKSSPLFSSYHLSFCHFNWTHFLLVLHFFDSFLSAILSVSEPFLFFCHDCTGHIFTNCSYSLFLTKDYDPRRMYLAAQAFFTSLGLDPLNDEFWADSIFEHPNDGRDMSCTAGVWDFMNAEDFR